MEVVAVGRLLEFIALTLHTKSREVQVTFPGQVDWFRPLWGTV